MAAPENMICSAAAQCGADCCDIIPLPVETFEKHWTLIEVPIVERIPLQGEVPHTLPVTQDYKCVFLDREKLICLIHEDRPPVCNDFGVIPELPCPYFDTQGKRRPRAERRRVIRKMNGQSMRRLKTLKRSLKS